jgi:Ricin-type beta-trefoil lectin domain
MLTQLGLPHRHMPRRTSAVVIGLVLAAGIGTASAPIASAAPATSRSAARVVSPSQVIMSSQVVNFGSYGLCLDKASGSNQSIVTTCAYMPIPPTQAFSLEPVSPYPYIQIENLNHNCLGVEGDSIAQGAAVVVTSCALTKNREWDPVYIKTVNGIYMFEFVNRNSGLCLTDDNDSDVPGHKVNQSTCTKADAMLWYTPLNGGSI